jgi:hypothetical protein
MGAPAKPTVDLLRAGPTRVTMSPGRRRVIALINDHLVAINWA